MQYILYSSNINLATVDKAPFMLLKYSRALLANDTSIMINWLLDNDITVYQYTISAKLARLIYGIFASILGFFAATKKLGNVQKY